MLQTPLERLLCIMSNVGEWRGDLRCKYKKVTVPECWLLLVVGTYFSKFHIEKGHDT